MYYVHIKDMVMDDPYPMYQEFTELIEADGEAQDLFLEQTVADQCPSQYFTAIDWVSAETIDLNIVDYINQNTYDLFESCFMQLDEDEEVSYTKAHSMLIACIAQTSKARRCK